MAKAAAKSPDAATNAQSAIIDALNQSVAETVVASMLAQNFHWNVRGMSFGALHALFQTIYTDHFQGQDDLAERIRALDGHAEGTLAGMIKRSKIKEHAGAASDAEMVRLLMRAEETLAATLKECATTAADNDDSLTEDMCIGRAQVHEKFAWMLRAHLA